MEKLNTKVEKMEVDVGTVLADAPHPHVQGPDPSLVGARCRAVIRFIILRTPGFNPTTMSLIFRRGVASMASLKKASKVVCIGRNYAYVVPRSSEIALHTDGREENEN